MKNVLLMLMLVLVSCVSGDPQPIVNSKTIPGAATDSVNTAIPDQPFVFREQDYSTNHPELPGVKMSFNTMYLIFKLGTSVAEANEIIKSIDAEIVGGRPGVSDKVEGVLLLRTPTTTHPQMIAIIQQLQANPKVKVAVAHHQYDSMRFYEPQLQSRVVSTPHDSIPFNWQWDLNPLNGNWGLEFSRVPQMWSFNAAIAKKGDSTTVGILDGGTVPHEDIEFLVNSGATEKPSHGLHVSGIIGATFNTKNNSTGIDGINPYTKLITKQYTQDWYQDLIQMIQDFPNLQVINVSLGSNWYDYKPAINPNTNLTAQAIILGEALIFTTKLDILRANGKKIPFIVVAAGNDSGSDFDLDKNISIEEKNILAKWSNALNYSSIIYEDPNIIVVEAIDDKNTRADFSNIGGQIAAPGVDITSTINTNGRSDYGSKSGTSMATPHVTGLISYLLALDPDLDTAQIRKLLLENSIDTLGGSSPHMDAFSSAMDIDRLRGNDEVLKKLLDIDDGTADGNLRLMIGAEDAISTDANNDGLDDAYLTSDKPLKILATPFVGEDANNDKGIGDGKVTMSDFRRWRDWLLEADSNPGNLFTNLNGENNHPKKDLNGDGKILEGTRVEIAVSENVYANGDFNGDGKISETATRAVSGNFGKAEKTDLEVFQRLFNDLHYKAQDLPDLINSSDITVSPKTCFAVPGVTSVRSSVRRQGTEKTFALERRTHESKASLEIYTVSIGINSPNYTVLIEALNAAGKVVASAEKDLIVGTELFAGSDTLVDGCVESKQPDKEFEVRGTVTYTQVISLSNDVPITSSERIADINKMVYSFNDTKRVTSNFQVEYMATVDTANSSVVKNPATGRLDLNVQFVVQTGNVQGSVSTISKTTATYVRGGAPYEPCIVSVRNINIQSNTVMTGQPSGFVRLQLGSDQHSLTSGYNIPVTETTLVTQSGTGVTGDRLPLTSAPAIKCEERWKPNLINRESKEIRGYGSSDITYNRPTPGELQGTLIDGDNTWTWNLTVTPKAP
jgi:subtilisin family serine protease